MKKSFLLIVAVVLTTLVASAKSFYYNGVGFEHEKSWKISASPNGIIGVNDDYRFYIQLSKITQQVVNSEQFVSAELEKKIDDILEQSYGNKKMKLKKKSEMQDGDINAMPTKYVDVTFSGGMCKRYYCLEWRGYLIDIEISGKGNSFHKEFKKILNSFTFTPEVM